MKRTHINMVFLVAACGALEVRAMNVASFEGFVQKVSRMAKNAAERSRNAQKMLEEANATLAELKKPQIKSPQRVPTTGLLEKSISEYESAHIMLKNLEHEATAFEQAAEQAVREAKEAKGFLHKFNKKQVGLGDASNPMGEESGVVRRKY